MQEFIVPDYGGRSLSDLLPAIGAALGVDLRSAPADDEAAALVLPPAPAYVLFLIDGLGAHLLRDHADRAPYLASLLASQETGATTGTAGVPSTTATSLTSLGTGLPPGRHGVVGYTSRIPGTQRLLNALQWSRDVDPTAWQPHPTAYARLSAKGVATTVVNRREYADSGLTTASQRGANYVGADRIGERIVGAIRATGHEPSLVYLYEGDLDWTGHRFGIDSPAWRHQLTSIDAQARQLRDALPPSVRLLVVADHGMVDTSPEARVDIEEVPALRDGLVLFGGEARFRHLYCRAGAVDDVLATWREYLSHRAEVISREEALARGWFGADDVAVQPRIGDVVVAARANFAVVSSLDFAFETRLIGLHGSLTAAEMEIPILLD